MLRCSFLSVVVVLASTVSASAQESGQIVRINTVHNVVRGGQTGMLIQIDTVAAGLKDRPVIIGAFFWTPAGVKLLARPGAFSTADGQVTAQGVETPMFVVTQIYNTELFVPYDELSLGIRGVHRQNFRIQMQYFNGREWVRLAESAAVPYLVRQD